MSAAAGRDGAAGVATPAEDVAGTTPPRRQHQHEQYGAGGAGAQPLSRLGRAAMAYVERLRWPVFRLGPRSKVPLAGSHGVHDATADVETVRRWWRESPAANIGLAAGAVAGWWALDVDPRNGGELTLSDLEAEHGRVPDTVMQATGGGGLHYLFRWPADGRLPCRSAGAGLDVKGQGGYIVAAPSVHPSGGEYVWLELCRPGAVQIAAAPEWLLELVCDPPETGERAAHTAAEWAALVQPVEAGSGRHERLLRVVGLLVERLPAPVALDLARLWAAARLRPPLDDRDRDRVISYVLRKKERELREREGDAAGVFHE